MPRTGLNIPIVTALDENGNIIEADQRRIVDHTIQNGSGAESLFICGTTGEFNRLTNLQRQQLLEIGVDATRKANLALRSSSEQVEAWVGVTSESKAETIENLRLAKDLKADMAVVAPLAISDLEEAEIVDFFAGDIARVIGAEATLPIGLYENPDIATVPDGRSLMPNSVIAELAKLPFIACLKASVNREVTVGFIKEFAPALPYYFGNAPLIFQMFEIQRDAGMEDKASVVAGVVSGTGNLFPTEWRQAWSWAVHNRPDKNAALKEAFADFEALANCDGTVKLLAAIKQGMYSQGIISSPHVGKGTPAFTEDEAERLNSGLDEVVAKLRANVSPQYLSHYASVEQMAHI